MVESWLKRKRLVEMPRSFKREKMCCWWMDMRDEASSFVFVLIM